MDGGNKKFYASLTPLVINQCQNDVESEVTKFIAAWKEKDPDNKEIGTMVFAVNVGTNHFATYACNTNGEILAINSMGGNYAKWDEAAIKGMQSAFEAKNIDQEEPIRITPDSKGSNQQDTSICGGITAAMAVAISSDTSFKDQEASLKGHMSKLCGKDKNHYSQIRKEHQKLIDIYKGAVEPGENSSVKDNKDIQAKAQQGKADIRTYLRASEYHKPNLDKTSGAGPIASKNLQLKNDLPSGPSIETSSSMNRK